MDRRRRTASFATPILLGLVFAWGAAAPLPVHAGIIVLADETVYVGQITEQREDAVRIVPRLINGIPQRLSGSGSSGIAVPRRNIIWVDPDRDFLTNAFFRSVSGEDPAGDARARGLDPTLFEQYREPQRRPSLTDDPPPVIEDPPVTTPDPPPTTPVAELERFEGDGFSIEVPSGWVKSQRAIDPYVLVMFVGTAPQPGGFQPRLHIIHGPNPAGSWAEEKDLALASARDVSDADVSTIGAGRDASGEDGSSRFELTTEARASGRTVRSDRVLIRRGERTFSLTTFFRPEDAAVGRQLARCLQSFRAE